MRLLLTDACEWLYPDTLPKSLKAPVLHIARGGVAGIAVVLTGLTPGSRITFAADTPGCRFFRMASVNVQFNTGENGFCTCSWSPESKSITRKAPFRVYDALQPVSEPFTAEAETEAVYVRFEAAKNAKIKKIGIVFSDGETIAETSFTVTVHKTKLPATGKDSVYYTNWIFPEEVAKEAKTELWTAKFWSALREHAMLMKQARQNTFLVPLKYFYADGKLNTARLKKYIDTFTEAGLYWIESGHAAARLKKEWNATEFSVMETDVPVRSPEGNKLLAEHLVPLWRAAEKYGWKERWIQHAADEPIDCNAESYRILTGIIRKYMPGVKIMDATCNLNIAGSVDIWCPQVQEYQAHQADFEALQAQGDHVWAYTCCLPGGKYLNRLLDGELARPVLLGWGCAAYGIEGFLHWGWNYWKDGDPFEDMSPDWGSGNRLPPGDTHIAYPGKDGALWGSLRMEAHRTGLEAWELVKILKKKDPAAADKIVKKVFRTFNDYTTDMTVIRKAEKALLDALDQ